MEDGRTIHDRHGDNVDPMVRLREEIIRCFITESPDLRRKPLTYQDKMNESADSDEILERQHTIKQRTPGMGVTADGFIHTTLCRLPLECLSSNDIELDQIHRLCREASATFNGHRMVIGKFRFLETMGEGGESNPCFKPLYDETIDAPSRHTVGIDGSVAKQNALKIQQADTHQTIGPVRNFLGQPAAMNVSSSDGDNEVSPKKGTHTLSELFQPRE